MKKIIILLAILALPASTFLALKYKDKTVDSAEVEKPEHFELTNSKLALHKLIWPIPEIDSNSNLIELNTSFFESNKIKVTVDGDWQNIVWQIKYRVIDKNPKFPYDELSFITHSKIPTPESGIREKKHPWAFKDGEKFFYLQKIEQVETKDYFEIIAFLDKNRDINNEIPVRSGCGSSCKH